MDFNTVITTCPYCACGCGLCLEVLDGRIVRHFALKNEPYEQRETLHQGLECA